MVKTMNSFGGAQINSTSKGNLFKEFYTSGRIDGCVLAEADSNLIDDCISSKIFLYTLDANKSSPETIVILFDSKETDDEFTTAVKNMYGSAEEFLETEQVVILQTLSRQFPQTFALKYSMG